MIKALLDFGFNQINLEEISGSTVSANTRISRLVIFVRSGADWMTDSPQERPRQRGWSEVEWLLTKARWRDRRDALQI